MGGKGNSATNQAQDMMASAFKDMSGLNKQLQAEASPWRQAAGGAYSDMLKNPAAFTAPGRNELARGTASNLNTVEQMQPGGARDRAARDLKMNQITQNATMLNQGKASAAQALGNLGVGVTQTGISAMGQGNQAAGGIGQIGQGQTQAKASGAQGFGSLLGSI